MHPPQGPPPARSPKPDGLVSVGWVMFAVGVLAGATAAGRVVDPHGADQLVAGAIVATPLMVSGAVIAAAGHLLRGR